MCCQHLIVTVKVSVARVFAAVSDSHLKPIAQVEGLASNALGGLSKLQNLSITLQRRWSNVLSDAQRQHTVELFLGLRLPKYLPSAQPIYSATLPLEVAEVGCGLAVTSDASAEQGRPCFCTCAGLCRTAGFSLLLAG